MIIEYLNFPNDKDLESRGYNGKGYYFWDEADGQYCYGPYSTYDQALVAFDKYAENLMNDKAKTTQDRIDEIMDNFDFAKVVKAMEALDWNWATAHADDGIPSEYEARAFARNLLKQAAARIVSKEDNCYYLGCGGFVVRKYYDGGLELEFVLTSWSSPSE